jgi:starch synthase
VEKLARGVSNIRIIPWQTEETLGDYIFAADVLLIPPSLQPLAKFGSTVLPLKLFFYLGSGRPILAGDTPDVAEVLKNNETALLCRPDALDALVAGLTALTNGDALANRLAESARTDSQNYTWSARAKKIATVVEGWRQAAGTARPGGWGKGQSGTWVRQSHRWFVHFARTRSWVLPPDALPPAP